MSTETIALTIAFASVIAVGALAVYVIRMRSAEATVASTEIVTSLNDFTTKFATDQGVVSEKFEQLDKKLALMKSSVDRREGAIDQQMGLIGDQVTGIVSLFSNDRARGSWGELSLERIFEVAGLVEGRDYRNQFSDGEGRPDVVVFLPGDRTIVIDSKFPIARYLDALKESDETKREQLMVAHGKELESVGKGLAKKHYHANATAGYVIIFLPSQAVYEAAAAAHPEVIERLLEQSIIVAGPVSVFGLIKTAGTLMAEHRAVNDAREIVSEVRELRSRLGVFAGHLEKVGRGINGAASAFNKAIGSWNSRLSQSVNRIAEMSGVDELAHIDQVQESIGATAPNDLKEAV